MKIYQLKTLYNDVTITEYNIQITDICVKNRQLNIKQTSIIEI